MKILFTSVGRRVELVQAFKNAADRLNIKLDLYGVDVADSAPALFFCDYSVIVPRINDPAYIPELKRICIKEEINALIPTIDTDLMVLAENKNSFGNTRVVISAPEKVSICRNKNFTADYFHSVGLKSPDSVDNWQNYHSGFPAFIKPKDGSSSIFAHKVNSEEDLRAYVAQVPDYIIQPYIEGTEYTVDVLCDFNGNPIFITPRIRVAVRAGEVLKTEIAQDDRIIAEVKQLVADYKPCGQITVQMIREKATDEDYYIEINPRFGGGAPLSIKAGADSAEAMIRLLAGEKMEYQEKAAENGAVFSRFDQSIRVK